MPKMLNLDEVAASTERVLTIKGVTYAMKPMSVADFIEYTSATQAEQLKATKTKAKAKTSDKPKPALEKSIKDIMETFIEMVTKSFPTLPDEIVRGLTLDQLNAIVSFARGEQDPEAEEEEKK
jgi:hypothetical protein